MQGIVFSIEEFSVYDGPGIRTTVFLKGCPLRCSWCHNPEGQSRKPEIVKSPNGCLHCGNCLVPDEKGVPGITWDSIQKCPMNLLRISGEIIESKELVKRLLKNERLLQKGGITFSGGEPTMQDYFLCECMEQLKGRLHLAVQTCGFCSEEVFGRVLGLADYVLYDLKLIDPVLHKKYTGVSNEVILTNFKTLAQSGKAFCVRVPLIPGVIDTKENITAISELLKKWGITYVELLPYNKMAGSKYAMMRREYQPQFEPTVESQTRQDIFYRYAIKSKVL